MFPRCCGCCCSAICVGFRRVDSRKKNTAIVDNFVDLVNNRLVNPHPVHEKSDGIREKPNAGRIFSTIIHRVIPRVWITLWMRIVRLTRYLLFWIFGIYALERKRIAFRYWDEAEIHNLCIQNVKNNRLQDLFEMV